MLTASELDVGWNQLLSRVGSRAELEATAQASGALVRRREIKSAEDLLRLALAYGPCGMFLRGVAAWAQTMGLGELSDVAALKRLRGSAGWLERIVGTLLTRRLRGPPLAGGRTIRLVDGPPISERGRGRAGWRLRGSSGARAGR